MHPLTVLYSFRLLSRFGRASLPTQSTTAERAQGGTLLHRRNRGMAGLNGHVGDPPFVLPTIPLFSTRMSASASCGVNRAEERLFCNERGTKRRLIQ
jgi:hypothetical protein